MPRYRDRRVPNRISTGTPMDGPAFRVDFIDGYQPATTDTDIMQVVQGNKTAAWFNEVFYYRAQHVPGHNSDALIRFVETVAASGNVLEVENEARTGRIVGIDQHTGAVKLWDVAASHLVRVAPGATRPAALPAGVAFTSAAAFASTPDPGIYGVVGVTMDPNLCTLNRSLPSQELWAAKWFCNTDATIDTLTFRVRTATAVVGASYSGVGVYSDDGTTLTLLASSADDTSLFTSTGQKTKTLNTPVGLVAGNSYWFAILANWSGTTLEISTTASTTAAGTANSFPGGNTTLLMTGQTSLPASITKASQTANTVRPMIGFYDA